MLVFFVCSTLVHPKWGASPPPPPITFLVAQGGLYYPGVHELCTSPLVTDDALPKPYNNDA